MCPTFRNLLKTEGMDNLLNMYFVVSLSVAGIVCCVDKSQDIPQAYVFLFFFSLAPSALELNK